MQSEQPVLVTGATGNVGREVVRALQRHGLAVRAGMRDPARSPFEGVEVVHFDFADPDTWGPAAAGCRGVFLLRPPAISKVRETLVPFIDAARAVGAAHVVFLSVAGAGEMRWVPHHTVEAHLQAAEGPWTLLRPGFFAQNLQDAYLRDVVEADRIYVPAGSGRVAFVDLADVAEVAAQAFAEPAVHAGVAHTLTGPEAIPFTEVAALLTAALGRPIVYRPASVPGYLWHLIRHRGLGWGQAVVQTILHVGLRVGQAEAVDLTLERLLGRPGTRVADYVARAAPRWRR